MNTLYKINEVVKFLVKSGWKVVFGNPEIEDSLCDPASKTITINATNLKTRLYTLLHEAGHSIIFDTHDYTNSYGEIYKQFFLKYNEQTNLYHYQVLKEEMLAWETGLNIADSLNIDIDKHDYDVHAAKQYMSYVYRASLNYYQDEVKAIAEKANIDIDFTKE